MFVGSIVVESTLVLKFWLTFVNFPNLYCLHKNVKNKVYKYFNFLGGQEKVYCWKWGGKLSTIKLAV